MRKLDQFFDRLELLHHSIGQLLKKDLSLYFPLLICMHYIVTCKHV